MNDLPAAEGMLCLRRRINRDKRGGAVPLSTYENIIPQCRKFVKRLEAVFKKNISGNFFGLGGGQFFSLNVAWVFNTKGKLKWKERRERKKEGREKRNKEKKRFINRKENIFVHI